MDTPEAWRTRCEKEKRLAEQGKKRFLISLIQGGRRVHLIYLRKGKYDPIFRVIVDGKDVSEIMMKKGYARPYDGKS
ncbi:MAG: nuclease, partial [bacterium]